jgi:hypothetical protein
MQKLVFLGILACSLVAGLSFCGVEDNSFVEVRGDRAKLIAPFESYESISTVRRRLTDGGFTWAVIENSQTVAKGEKRPPFQIYVIKIENFSNQGFEGTLKLQFFNDRMMATWFYPKNFASYRAALESRHPELRSGRATVIEQFTRIEFGVDHEQRAYVVWEDSRLRDELDLWIKRYA